MSDPIKHPSKTRVVLLALGLATFVVFGWVLVPRALAASYKGEGIPALDRVIAGMQRGKDRPLEKYLSIWAEFRVLALGIGLGVASLTTDYVRRLAGSFSRRFVVPCTPGTLGAIRCLVFALLLFSVLIEDLSSVAFIPIEIREKMGLLEVLQLLPYRAFEALHQSEPALLAFQALTATLLTFATVGLWTRLTVPIGAALYFVFGGILREYSHFYHSYLLAMYLAAALSLMPAGDGWSFDRLIRLARGRPVADRDEPAEVYGWCRMICWTLIAVTYMLAGMSKIANGKFGWLSADNIRRIQVSDTLNPSVLTFVDQDWGPGLLSVDMPDLMLSGMAAMAMLGEFFYFLVVFSVWARRVFPPLMAGMHVGIMFLQRLFFLDSILLQAIFFDWRAARLRVGDRVARRWGRVDVVIGPGASSRRIESVLRELDLFGRLRFVDENTGGVGPAGAFPVATTRDGRVLDGPAAVRKIAGCLPLTWPVSLLAGRPWAIATASRAWSAMSGRTATDAAPSPTAPDRRTHEFAFFSAMTFYFIISMINWSVSRELYPISGWGMYSSSDGKSRGGHPEVGYFKVLAHYEDGRVEYAPIWRWIAVMREARYKDHVFKHFVLHESWSEPEKLAKLLDVCMRRANASAAPGRRVVGIEMQAWHWAMGDPAEDKTKGKIYDRRYQPAPG